MVEPVHRGSVRGCAERLRRSIEDPPACGLGHSPILAMCRNSPSNVEFRPLCPGTNAVDSVASATFPRETYTSPHAPL